MTNSGPLQVVVNRISVTVAIAGAVVAVRVPGPFLDLGIKLLDVVVSNRLTLNAVGGLKNGAADEVYF